MVRPILALTAALISCPTPGSGQPVTRRGTAAAPEPDVRRPVVAVIGSHEGTELTDFLIPRAILAEAGVAEVVTVAPTSARIRMLDGTTITVEPDLTFAAFDSTHRRADYVIVPALEPSDAIERWIRSQAARGATIVAICDGVWTVARTGLLERHRATGHWASLPELRLRYPGTTWIRDRRYVVDRRIITTTGVSAATPASLMLVERIGGKAAAARVARRIAVTDWSPSHQSDRFSRSQMPFPMPAFMDTLTRWRRDTVVVRVGDAVDEVALGLTLDALSRRATVLTVSDRALVVTGRQGLRVTVDRLGSERLPAGRELRLSDPQSTPTNALDAALTKLAQWYGGIAAELVALQMEYPHRAPE